MEDESENSHLVLLPWVPEAASCDHPENKQDNGFEESSTNTRHQPELGGLGMFLSHWKVLESG